MLDGKFANDSGSSGNTPSIFCNSMKALCAASLMFMSESIQYCDDGFANSPDCTKASIDCTSFVIQSTQSRKNPFDEFRCRLNPSHALLSDFSEPDRLSVLVLACSSAVLVPVMASSMSRALAAFSASTVACAPNIFPTRFAISPTLRCFFSRLANASVRPTTEGFRLSSFCFSRLTMIERRAVPAVEASKPACANCSRLATSCS